jgi:hypothetical protein
MVTCGLARSSEDEESIFLQNSGIYVEVHMALLPIRPTMTQTAELATKTQ